MRRIRKFFQLSADEKHLFLRAVFLLWAVRIALRLLPFRTVNAYVAARSCAGRSRPRELSLSRLSWIMSAAGVLLPGQRTCLVRALAGSLLIGSQGHLPTLRIGVVREGEHRLEAHAWLECEGQVLVGDTQLERYTVFPPITKQK